MAQQRYQCPICMDRLQTGQMVALDHSHENGHVRSVLCRSCNVSEGKVLAGTKFRTSKANMAYKNPVQWLRNLADYLEYHKDNPSGIIHPTFDLEKGKQKPAKRRSK